MRDDKAKAAKCRIPRLLAQVRALLATARADPDLLREVPPADLQRLGRDADRLEALAATARRTGARAQLASVKVRRAERRGVVWLRAVRHRHAIGERRYGLPPLRGPSPTRIRNARRLAAEIARVVSVSRLHPRLAEVGLDERRLARGLRIRRMLMAASDRRVEARVKHASELIDLRERVYAGVTLLAVHGQAVHAERPDVATRYALDILYRGRRRRRRRRV